MVKSNGVAQTETQICCSLVGDRIVVVVFTFIELLADVVLETHHELPELDQATPSKIGGRLLESRPCLQHCRLSIQGEP